MLVIIILVVLIVFYLLSIKPNTSRKQALKAYEQVYICHRGFYDNDKVPENSLVAFKKAVENNYGIELDVQLTLDDKLVVFHDVSLKRMTGIDKKLCECTYEELLNYQLLNTNEKIPLFSEVLKILNKNTPLIIEVKPEGRCIEATKETIKIIRNYDGLYNMESFNPKVVYYLKKNEPDIIRGQLAYNYFSDSKISFILKLSLTNLLFNFLTKPDYIAYEHHASSNLSFRICSKLYKAECVAWTIKSQDELNNAKNYYQQFIFDSFIPDKNK
ncbi:MAG: hypothetical protein IJH31_02735 [Erysipelotrichaceae bacterium]|nr:hypothetical protein [Erysipelotrichaceae bacterium]